MKKIKLFNGNLRCKYDPITGKYIDIHAYVGAYSEKHAVELCEKAGSCMSLNELRVYWSKGLWGNAMDGIEPEVGVWIQEGWDGKVQRVI